MLKIVSLNTCGWTPQNAQLREEIIRTQDLDIITISETHLKGEELLVMNDYTWFGHNRRSTHINAWRGSGGVGVLVKGSVLQIYDVLIYDKSYDGILCLVLTDKEY